jgi:hypothetical protein
MVIHIKRRAEGWGTRKILKKCVLHKLNKKKKIGFTEI